MKYLLDTHAFLWFVTDDNKLSSKAKSIIQNSNNEVYFSAASAWEMSIKTKLGRLRLGGTLESFIIEQLTVNRLSPLAITVSHSLYTEKLPQIHKDPFDRIMISQSKVENMALITQDKEIRKYKVSTVW
ncbi:MAG: type II toxin-antitoxin system VapC family toxin [Desulfobacterales bacterium]|jgi:PIN domain nuclease of toxin-antitoxin system